MARPKNHFPMPKKLRRGSRSNRPQNLLKDWLDNTGEIIQIDENNLPLPVETRVQIVDTRSNSHSYAPRLTSVRNARMSFHPTEARELTDEDRKVLVGIVEACAAGNYETVNYLEINAIKRGLDQFTLSVSRIEGYRTAREKLSKERER